jgi:hypothetical protein
MALSAPQRLDLAPHVVSQPASGIVVSLSHQSRSTLQNSFQEFQGTIVVHSKTDEGGYNDTSLRGNFGALAQNVHQLIGPPNSFQAARPEDMNAARTVGVFTKTPYVRPHRALIYFSHCSERLEGFRGTHELERHIARAHTPTRKGYICVDNSTDKAFLSKCKR